MDTLSFVELPEARAARGVRLVVTGALPSPWGEAAKALFRVKGIPALCARVTRITPEIAAAIGTHNVPVVFHDDEPPRTGWAEILALAERLGGRTGLVPADLETRVRLHGLAHELLGEGGLSWNARLIMIHASITSGGRRSWPLPVAEYLAAKYGYAPERMEAARSRTLAVLALFERQLTASQEAGHRYLLGDAVSALDLYLATTLTIAVGLPASDCPGIRDVVRPALAHLHEEIGAQIPEPLIAHRRLVFEQHLPGPIVI
jgi:glutathione S-transferase